MMTLAPAEKTDRAEKADRPEKPDKSDRPHITALIAAAGRGQRMQQTQSDSPLTGRLPPKQYQKLGEGLPVLRQTMLAFEHHPAITAIQVVIHPDDMDAYMENAAGIKKALPPVMGGERRQDSVLAGLTALQTQSPPDFVLIHDAARPFISRQLISDIIAKLLDTATKSDGVIPLLPLTDTIKTVQGEQIAGTVARDTLHRAQTPQGFHFDRIYAAYQKVEAGATGAAKNKQTTWQNMTDDAAIAEQAGLKIIPVAGDSSNIKITTIQDLAATPATSIMHSRTASGMDAHRFGAGDHIMLGGIRIEHTHGLVGHSDADVALHALTDAVLGTIAAGDLGSHFPPENAQWKNHDSADFLAFAVELIRQQHGHIVHLDLTLVCEAPKIAPFRAAMQQRIANIAGIAPQQVSIKATSFDGMGFTGRGEGIFAQAQATIALPTRLAPTADSITHPDRTTGTT